MQNLRFGIKDMKNHRQGVSVDVRLPQEVLEKELSETGLDVRRTSVRLRATLSLIPGGELIEVRGEITGSLGLVCQRCLEEVDASLAVPLHAQFSPAPEKAQEDSFSLEEPDAWHHDHEFVDLLPMVREQIILAIPMQTVCQEQCLGLCPVCGENRNHVPCTCATSEKRSPFSILAQWKSTNS